MLKLKLYILFSSRIYRLFIPLIESIQSPDILLIEAIVKNNLLWEIWYIVLWACSIFSLLTLLHHVIYGFFKNFLANI